MSIIGAVMGLTIATALGGVLALATAVFLGSSMQWHNSLTVGAAVVILAYGSFAIWRSNVPTAPIAPALAQPASDPMVDAAIEHEAQRIVSFAATDPECGVQPNPVDCFLSRLEEQNRDAIGRELFRMEALKVAREGQGGN